MIENLSSDKQIDGMVDTIEELEAREAALVELIREADKMVNDEKYHGQRLWDNWLLWRSKCKDNGIEL